MHGFQITAKASRPDPGDAMDRRLARRAALAESLAGLAEHLPPDDHALIRSVFQDGKTAVEVGRLCGDDPRRLRRRIRRLTRRVLSPEYLFVLRHKDRWPAARRKVATACILHGRSMREASDELRIPLYTVRRHCEAVLAAFETIGKDAGRKRDSRP